MLYSFLLLLTIIFTAFSPNQNNVEINKIEFSSKGCFGKCPIWKLTIDNQNDAYLFAEKYNKQDGNFKAKLGKEEIEELKNLVNKMEQITIKEYYNDGPTCGNINELKVYLKDKVISTRSMRLSGPKEVQNLLAAIIQLKEKTSWQAADLQ